MFIQYRLWNDCNNHCSFCSLENNIKTPTNIKKLILINSINNIKKINRPLKDKLIIGLIGGEFFDSQLTDVFDYWKNLIETINNVADEIFITATLINFDNTLLKTLSLCRKPVLLCTSYDTNGRFRTLEERNKWLENINTLHNSGYNICCTVIPTNTLLSDTFVESLPTWLEINLSEPHSGIDWIKNMHDKDNYHNNLLSNCKYLVLPERHNFLQWASSHSTIIRNYLNYFNNRSNIVYRFDKNGNIEFEFNNRLHENIWIDSKCNHPYISKCYADSDKCMMCDCERLLNI